MAMMSSSSSSRRRSSSRRHEGWDEVIGDGGIDVLPYVADYGVGADLGEPGFPLYPVEVEVYYCRRTYEVGEAEGMHFFPWFSCFRWVGIYFDSSRREKKKNKL